jgi:hypothetical protein
MEGYVDYQAKSHLIRLENDINDLSEKMDKLKDDDGEIPPEFSSYFEVLNRKRNYLIMEKNKINSTYEIELK